MKVACDVQGVRPFGVCGSGFKDNGYRLEETLSGEFSNGSLACLRGERSEQS